MYTLVFDPSSEGRERLEICFQAIVATDRNVTSDNEDDFIELLKAIKGISTETNELLSAGSRVRLRVLNPTGGHIALERSAYRLLVDLVKRPIWRPQILEQKRAVQEWLASIKEQPSVALLSNA